MTTVTVSMPESLKQFIDSEVETKGFGNVNEYIRSLLREAQSKTTDARLETLQLEGLTGGNDIPLASGFWQELKVDAAHILAKHRKAKEGRAQK